MERKRCDPEDTHTHDAAANENIGARQPRESKDSDVNDKKDKQPTLEQAETQRTQQSRPVARSNNF